MGKVTTTKIEIRQGATTLDLTEKVTALTIKDSLLTGTMDWKLELQAKKLNDEEDFMFETGTRELRFSFTRDKKEISTGWKLVTINKSSLFYTGSLPLIKVWGSTLASEMREVARWRSFIGADVAEILGEIAHKYGLKTKTDVTTRGTWYQLGEDDWTFLRRICQEIVSPSGHRAVWLYVDNKTLSLEPLQFSKPAVRSFGIGTSDDRLDSVEFRAYGREIDFLGGASAVLKGFDIQNKRFLEVSIGDSVIPNLAGRLPRPFTSGRRFFIYSGQDNASLIEEGLAHWVMTTSRYFSFQGSLSGDMTLKPGDIVDLKIIDPDKTTSVLNGKYPVYEVVHTYRTVPVQGAGGAQTSEPLNTMIGGFRRTFNYGANKAGGANLSRLTSIDKYTSQNPVDPDRLTLVAQRLKDFFI